MADGGHDQETQTAIGIGGWEEASEQGFEHSDFIFYFFFQGRCLCCVSRLALLQARAGMTYVLQM